MRWRFRIRQFFIREFGRGKRWNRRRRRYRGVELSGRCR
jgi:hypothetical protein